MGTFSMTPAEFAAKWRRVTTSERASAQSHFSDLCHMLGEPLPHEADPTGLHYAFEKRLLKSDGRQGFADVWKRGFFAWEYKGSATDLREAYHQLQLYKDALENPPLLVVSDFQRIEVRTNFTNLSPVTIVVTLEDLAATDPSEALATLRAVFSAPDELRPTFQRAVITEEAGRRFAELAISLRGRGHDPHEVAQFLHRLLFCLFAEDAELLPKGLLGRMSSGAGGRAEVFTHALSELFERMATGGMFGPDQVRWFNGGLFDSPEVLPLTGSDISTLVEVSRLDWGLIEPAIFGTLFERGLDPEQRAQLGAHYTDRAAIWGLVEPVVVRPLRREFVAMQARVTELLELGRRVSRATPAAQNPTAVFHAFLDRLRRVRVLDPACGSGNFLLVSLWALKDLEHEAIQWGSLVLRDTMRLPEIGPECVLGIEINPYAAELARVAIWIGEIQWMLRHGFGYNAQPVLRPLANIETRDALLDTSEPTKPREAEWPAAEFIVGNPPFLGAKLLRRVLGEGYVETLYGVYGDRLAGMSDLVAYWHEKARAQIVSGKTKRAGLLATQGIRGGKGRNVLERIEDTGGIFFARADEPWVLSGANVRISFIGQDEGSETERELNGKPVTHINADLTSGADLTTSVRLLENAGIAFIADVKGGPFDIPASLASEFLSAPNPDGRPNSDVVRRWANGQDITGRSRNRWIIDFGTDMPLSEAALYERPFEFALEHVKPARITSLSTQRNWWIHERPGHSMRHAIAGLARYIATPALTKHRLFVWLDAEVLPDHQLVVIAREDDYTFGLLHSRLHELWALRRGTRLEDRPRYTPTTTFETFPFPEPDPDGIARLSMAAERLDALRRGWLDPVDIEGDELEARTLTNLYNHRPMWLRLAHEGLDVAACELYGWDPDLGDEDLLERLLELNRARAGRSAPLRLATTR